MTNIQAFVLALIILTVQTITLIVFGFVFGIDGAAATLFLFVIVDVGLCSCAYILKIIKEK